MTNENKKCKKKKQEGKKSESLHASMHVLSQANYRNFNTISKHANLKTKPIKGIAMIIFQD